MWFLFGSALLAVLAAGDCALDAADSQLIYFNNSLSEPIGILSESSGCPVQNRLASSTLNTNLLRNEYFIESVDHIVDERIPERVVHTKGSGAFGYFEVTSNVSDLTKARFLATDGNQTRVAIRFSSATLKRGSSDVTNNVRGFAVKFYTEEGNFDIAGLNIPVQVSREPLAFLAFLHAVLPNPVTNIADNNILWDFITQNPDSLYASILLLSPLGLPLSYRYMAGYGIHTYQLANSNNETNFAKFYFIPDLGIQNMTAGSTTDPDYYGRDLYNAIANETYPSWTLYVQPLSPTQVANASAYGIDVFDVTKQLSTDDYPLREVGKLVLNENHSNYFADVEQLAFNPGNLVPGIVGGPDKLFEARTLAYRRAHIRRLGINFNKIEVNRPLGKVYTYNRDGSPPTLGNEGGAPSYFPNTFKGPVPVADYQPDPIPIIEERTTNYKQISAFYEESLSDTEKTTLAAAIAASFSGVTDVLVTKGIALLAEVNEDLSNRVEAVLAASA